SNLERGIKWFRRKPLRTALATVILLALFIGTVGAAIFTVKLSQAKTKAEQKEELARQEEDKAKQALEHTRAAYRASLQDMTRLGTLFAGRSENAEALSLYEKSLTLAQKLYPQSDFPSGHKDLARSLDNLGTVLYDMGAFDRALVYFEQALIMRKRLS